MEATKGTTRNAAPGAGSAWLAHGFAAVSSVMLFAAAVGWLTGGPEVIGDRSGLTAESAAAPALASLLGYYKGLLDLWPLPLAIWFALRRDYAGASLLWAVAVALIPLADIAANAMAGRAWGDAVVHIPYLVAMAGAALAYALAARSLTTARFAA